MYFIFITQRPIYYVLFKVVMLHGAAAHFATHVMIA
jgi:hypothetical protein